MEACKPTLAYSTVGPVKHRVYYTNMYFGTCQDYVGPAFAIKENARSYHFPTCLFLLSTAKGKDNNREMEASFSPTRPHFAAGVCPRYAGPEVNTGPADVTADHTLQMVGIYSNSVN